MNKIILLVSTLLLCVGLFAEWSTDAFNPSQISTLNDFQVKPKVSICNDGAVYTAWVEYDWSLANFNIVLQRLNQQGINQWQTPICVTSHPSQTSLLDWELLSDNDGNAILAYADDRNQTQNIYIYKVSPSAQMLWDTNGIALSSDIDSTYSNISPVMTCTTDNNIVVAWQRQSSTSTIKLQSINPDGNILWGTGGVTIQIDEGKVAHPKLLASTIGNVLIEYSAYIGMDEYPPSYVYVKKLGPTGTDAWDFPELIVSDYDSGAWSIAPDGTGGMVLALGADRNNNNYSEIYIQHVFSDGSLAFQTNGVPISTESNNAQEFPNITYNPQTQDTYILWCKTPILPNLYAVYMQKLDSDGIRQWGNEGLSYVPLDVYPIYIIDSMLLNGNFSIICGYGLGEEPCYNYHILAMSFDSEGQPLWQGNAGIIAFNNTIKQNFTACHTQNFVVVSWDEGWSPDHVFAMRFNADGSLGYQPTANEENVLHVNPMWLRTSPNPFQNSINIQFLMKNSASPVEISIYNLKGQEVQNFTPKNAENGQIKWDGKDKNGKALSSGIYLIKMQQGSKQVINKIAKLK